MKKIKKTKKFKFSKLDKQDKALLTTMAGLVVLVAVLAVVALNLKNNEQNEKANIVIPILEENTQNEISVDMSEMKKGDTKEYIFKVTNYKVRDINEEKIKYSISVTPTLSASIKLYKNNSNDNLIKNKNNEVNSTFTITNNVLEKSKKVEDSYLLIIEAKNTPSKQEKITLKINS